MGRTSPPPSAGQEASVRGMIELSIESVVAEAQQIPGSTVIKEHVVKHGDRAEADRFSNYPFAALEEALVNAVHHRSYEEREPIEVRILPDHITITSHPGADRSIFLMCLMISSLLSDAQFQGQQAAVIRNSFLASAHDYPTGHVYWLGEFSPHVRTGSERSNESETIIYQITY